MPFLWRIFLCVTIIAMISSGGTWMYVAAIPIAMLFVSLHNSIVRELLTLNENNKARFKELERKIEENNNE